MKLNARVGEKDYSIEIERKGEDLVATIDGRRLEMEVSEPEPGVFLLKKDGHVFEAFVSPKGPGGTSKVIVKGSEFNIDVFDPRRLAARRSSDPDAGGVAEIRTAMPGKVVRVLVGEGDSVKKGDGVVIVEAMKMQNEMKSPKSGTVKMINVQEGSTVGSGDVLVTIE